MAIRAAFASQFTLPEQLHGIFVPSASKHRHAASFCCDGASNAFTLMILHYISFRHLLCSKDCHLKFSHGSTDSRHKMKQPLMQHTVCGKILNIIQAALIQLPVDLQSMSAHTVLPALNGSFKSQSWSCALFICPVVTYPVPLLSHDVR